MTTATMTTLRTESARTARTRMDGSDEAISRLVGVYAMYLCVSVCAVRSDRQRCVWRWWAKSGWVLQNIWRVWEQVRQRERERGRVGANAIHVGRSQPFSWRLRRCAETSQTWFQIIPPFIPLYLVQIDKSNYVIRRSRCVMANAMNEWMRSQSIRFGGTRTSELSWHNSIIRGYMYTHRYI